MTTNISKDQTNEIKPDKYQQINFKIFSFSDESTMLASLVQFSDDAIIAKTLEGDILSWNNGAERIYGYKSDEIIGQPVSKLIPHGFENELPRVIEKIIRGEKTEHYDAKRIRKDGTIIDVSHTISPIMDSKGSIVAISSVARDVTAQKEAMLRSAQYARSLIEASLDPLVTISADGKITDVNEATIRVTGRKREELVGSDFSNYFTEAEKAREGYLQVFAKGFVADYPLTIRHKDGKLTDVLYNASIYKNVSGNVLGIFAAARDVTAQKQASQYARSLIEASLDPLVTISADGKITDVNEATIRVTGCKREDLVGSDFSNYFTEAEKAREGYQQVFAKGFVADYPLTIRHKDGILTDVLYNASIYKDVGGNVLGVFAAARDVTAPRKKAEREVAEQRAHELDRLSELERFQKLTVGRELKMIELKKEIDELKKRLGESTSL